MSDLQVVLGFDMETDIGSWTPFYEGLQHGTPVILDILDRHAVPATFFFTGDSLKNHPYAGHMVKVRGHEIGAHTLFHETIGDSLYEIPGMLPVLPEEVPNRLPRPSESCLVPQYAGRCILNRRIPAS